MQSAEIVGTILASRNSEKPIPRNAVQPQDAGFGGNPKNGFIAA
jgi:hypothetical protein